VIHHPLATAEIGEAARYYEKRVNGLGTQFLDEVDEAVRGIAAMPKSWPVIECDVRRYLLRRFPFALYYRIGADFIQILACKHHSRHPDYWRGRVRE
jgi:hypothetical protein